MKDTTSILNINRKDEYYNKIAFISLLSYAQEPSYVSDLFGGVGGFMAETKLKFPGVPAEIFEMDPLCLEVLKAKDIPDCSIIPGNCLELFHAKPDSGVIADFNLMTLKRAQGEFHDFLHSMFRSKIKWLILTDSAAAKLHINFPVYGCFYPKLFDYIARWNAWLRPLGYHIQNWQRPHFRSVLFLIASKEDNNVSSW